ncbi:MAG TPA: polyprenyl diphosphate synthase [Candidatus Paceibacterota bacterium]|nr:polyprenyl diphosphate synthase [Candidatus Paceibacterota bacterium]HOK97284.1 polyprenyl diphosphate synthase [Candidatus Paceibacterota bacterium]HPP64720.1 polyprenyl diphosphate synthase [Candidatus Paceibacterota bacterium]
MESSNNSLPQHLGIMIDGNRRWAKKRGLPPFEGHRKGIQRVEEIIKYAYKRGVKILTLYGFSTENWKRNPKEVNFLMNLFEKYVKKGLKEEQKKDKKYYIQFRHIGRKDRLPKHLVELLEKLEKATRKNSQMVVNVAIDYGGRDEVVRAVKKIIRKKLKPEEITEEVLMKNLDTGDLPDVDFVIRTSGEMRLSNFLPLQATYAELYFPRIYWPDFDKEQFDLSLEEFKKRERRFGK